MQRGQTKPISPSSPRGGSFFICKPITLFCFIIHHKGLTLCLNLSFSLDGLLLFLFIVLSFQPSSSLMASILRFRKVCYVEPCSSLKFQYFETPKIENGDEGGVGSKTENLLEKRQRKNKNKKQHREWRCIDSCCWVIGYMCTTCWVLLFLYHSLPATLTGFPVPESPGTRLKAEGLTPLHPVVLVPGIVTGGLELWEGRPCAEGLFRKRLWGGGFTEIFKRFVCLHN